MSKTTAEPREDFLEEDAPIPGQKFCLLSFLSPENVLKDKNTFFFSSFLENFEYSQRAKTYEEFLMNTVKGINDKLNSEADVAELKDLSGVAQTIRDARVSVDKTMNAFQTYLESAKNELKEYKLKEMYDEGGAPEKANADEEEEESAVVAKPAAKKKKEKTSKPTKKAAKSAKKDTDEEDSS